MQTKNILILNGHPGQSSLSRLFAETYEKAARANGHNVSTHHLNSLNFDADFGQSTFTASKPLEADLTQVFEDLENCDHFVLLTPMWWGNMPAKLRGLFDRILTPGRAFDPQITKYGLPIPLLTGKTGRVFITSDTPMWAMKVMYGRSMHKNIEKQILGFIGVKPTKFNHFAPASKATEKTVEKWADQVSNLGKKAA